jgi:hypothetical protein
MAAFDTALPELDEGELSAITQRNLAPASRQIEKSLASFTTGFAENPAARAKRRRELLEGAGTAIGRAKAGATTAALAEVAPVFQAKKEAALQARSLQEKEEAQERSITAGKESQATGIEAQKALQKSGQAAKSQLVERTVSTELEGQKRSIEANAEAQGRALTAREEGQIRGIDAQKELQARTLDVKKDLFAKQADLDVAAREFAADLEKELTGLRGQISDTQIQQRFDNAMSLFEAKANRAMDDYKSKQELDLEDFKARQDYVNDLAEKALEKFEEKAGRPTGGGIDSAAAARKRITESSFFGRPRTASTKTTALTPAGKTVAGDRSSQFAAGTSLKGTGKAPINFAEDLEPATALPEEFVGPPLPRIFA